MGRSVSAKGSRLEQVALCRAAEGYHVFPCQPRSKSPLTKNGFLVATRKEVQILHWWSSAPDANIGIACGASEIVVVDIDAKAGADFREVVVDLELVGHPAVVLTGEAPERGHEHPHSLGGVRGAHLYFRGALRTSKSEIPGVELRGAGSYVIGPGSAHASGVPYEGHLPHAAELPIVPESVVAILDRSGNGPAPPVAEVIRHGEQHNALVSIAGSMRRRGLNAREIAAALKEVNRSRCERPGSDEEMDAIANSMMRYEPSSPPVPKTTEHTEHSAAQLDGERARGVRSPTEHSAEQPPNTQPPPLAFEEHILARHDALMAGLGLVGERHVSRVTLLVHVSRLLRQPGRLVVKGDSSTGKSFATECSLKAAAPEALYLRTSTSAMALFYSDEDFRHRTLCFYEANALGDDDDPLARVLRTLISEGRLCHEVTVPEKRTSTLLEKEGPVAFISTTCRASLDKEIETRILSLHSDNTDAQTRDVVASILRAAADTPTEPDLSEWHALDRWLAAGPRDVVLPWAPSLAEFGLSGPPRLRRDISNLLSLASAHALLHRATRELDPRGRIISTLADYAVVRRVLSDSLAVATDRAVRGGTKAIVDAVGALRAEGKQKVSLRAASTKAGRSTSTTSTDVHDALDKGYLVNLSQRENQYDLDVGDPLPGGEDLLPSAEDLGRVFARRSASVRPPTEHFKAAPEAGLRESVRSVRSNPGGAGVEPGHAGSEEVPDEDLEPLWASSPTTPPDAS